MLSCWPYNKEKRPIFREIQQSLNTYLNYLEKNIQKN